MLSQSKPTICAVCACGAEMTRGAVDIAQCYEVLHSHCRQIKTIHKCGSSHQSRCSKEFCGHTPFRWSVDRVFLGLKNPGLKTHVENLKLIVKSCEMNSEICLRLPATPTLRKKEEPHLNVKWDDNTLYQIAACESFNINLVDYFALNKLNLIYWLRVCATSGATG